MKYLIADHHWGHGGIIKNTQRPFESIHEMNEYMIEMWNSVVGEDDEVYHLGDMSYKINPRLFGEILERLNGKIYLINGNHDKIKLIDRFKDRFEWVKDYYRFPYEYKNEIYDMILFHYPIYSWNRMWKGSIHVHGHTHNNSIDFDMKNPGRSVNVGVELLNYKPISIEELIENVGKKIVKIPNKKSTI